MKRSRFFIACALSIVFLLTIGMFDTAALAAAQKISGAKLSSKTLNQGRTVTLQYKLSKKDDVSIRITNSKGKLVASYTYKKVAANKTKTFKWAGKATKGNKLGLKTNAFVPSGKYTIAIASGGATKKLTVTFKAKPVAVKKVKLKPSKLQLEVGKKGTLTAEITPSNATNTKVTWKSSKTKVATVSSKGVVTAKAVGSAKITVTTKDGKKTHSITVTVKKKGSISPTATPKPTATAKPTATSSTKPTATPTAKPTATTKPTATATAKPTATPTAKPTATPKPTTPPVLNTVGNSSGNAMDWGLAAMEDGKLFYYEPMEGREGIYVVGSDGSFKLLRGGNYSCLNAINGMLYFLEEKSGSYWRMKQDGTGAAKILSGDIRCVHVTKDKIYFADYDAGEIGSANLDGSGRKRLVSTYDCFFNLGSDALYIPEYGGGMYTVKLDGTGYRQISTASGYGALGDDGYLYYVDNKDKTLYRMRTNGENIEQLSTLNCTSFCPKYQDGMVYFTSSGTNYRLNPSTKQATSYYNNAGYNFAVLPGYIVWSGGDIYDLKKGKVIEKPPMEPVNPEEPIKPVNGSGTVDSVQEFFTYTPLKIPEYGIDTNILTGGRLEGIISCSAGGRITIEADICGAKGSVTFEGDAGKKYKITATFTATNTGWANFTGNATVTLGSSSKSTRTTLNPISYSGITGVSVKYELVN